MSLYLFVTQPPPTSLKRGSGIEFPRGRARRTCIFVLHICTLILLDQQDFEFVFFFFFLLVVTPPPTGRSGIEFGGTRGEK